MPTITTSNKVLVDLAFILPVTGKEKIIFSRSGKTSLWFDFKKIFWGKRMEEEAAKRIKNIFNNYSEIDRTFINPFQSIKDEEGIDENAVIEAFADLEKRKKLKLPTQDLPAELENAKTIIDEKLKNSDSVALNKDILLLAQNKCTPPFNPNIIKKSLSHLDKIDKNDLNRIKFDDCSNILRILNHLKEEILVNPNDMYIKKVSDQIDKHIELLTTHLEKLKENKVNKEACETRIEKIIEHKNKIAATLSRYIPSFKNNNKALTAFVAFLENPTASFKPTREISTKDTLENLIDGPLSSLHKNYNEKKLKEFLAIFTKHASNLPAGETSDACFDAVDYLTGSLLAAVNSDIRFDPMYSAATEQVELKSALRKNWEQYGPSGFLLHLLNYDKSGIDAIDDNSYLRLNHLLKDHQRIAQITNNLPMPSQAGFSIKMQSLKNDLALFKETSEQIKIDKLAEYQLSDQRKMIVEDEVESREDLPSNQDRLLSADASRTKTIESIKNVLTKFSIFEKTEPNIKSKDSFIGFLYRSDKFTIDENNKRQLDQFFSLFFDQIKPLTTDKTLPFDQRLTIDERMLCLQEVDILEGLLLQYENNSIDAIDIDNLKYIAFDLATGIQFLSHALPPSGNLTHFIHYLKDGKSSINLINYWGLQYFCHSQHTQLKDLLHEPLRSYFQTQIGKLRQDLEELKPIYQA
jgi:hypothetical protein